MSKDACLTQKHALPPPSFIGNDAKILLSKILVYVNRKLNERLILIEIQNVQYDPVGSTFRGIHGKESFDEDIYFASGTILHANHPFHC